jgi:probable rRNA maturation factor
MARVSASRRRQAFTLELTVATRNAFVPARAELVRWLRAALPKAEQRRLVVSAAIVGYARSRGLNRRYRGRDKPTNVLSFAGAGPGPDGTWQLGELVFCAPLVAKEAREQGKSARAHWAHLAIHGLLHLRGYTHERPGKAREMESLEVQLLENMGFSDPYRQSAILDREHV